MSEMRRTTLRKSITRKINTGNYSNVDITCDIQQEVEWEKGNVKQLLEKSDGLTNLLLMDFKKSQKDIMNDLFPKDSDKSKEPSYDNL